MSEKPVCSRIPVFIGVTGHRTIRSGSSDIKRLKESVKTAIKELCRDCRYTDIILLTSLAAGADQLAAEAVEEMAQSMRLPHRSIRFAVVLPMEKERFFTRTGSNGPDFTPEERRNAERLINSEHCAFVYTLPKQYRGPGDETVSQDDLQFREAARFISDSSFAGIALWDGKLEQGLQAGTGPTVRDFLHGKAYNRSSFQRITMPETRPIYHIYTPRINDPDRSYDFKIRRLFPEPLLEKGEKWFTLNGMTEEQIRACFEPDWHEVGADREKKIKNDLARIERYNRDVVKNADYIAENSYALNISKEEWAEQAAFSDGEDSGEGMLLQPGERAEMCERYHMAADALARLNQKKRRRGICWIVWTAGFAYMALNVFSDLFKNPCLLIAYIVLLIAAVAMHYLVDKRAYHSRFVDYRALAEGLRVQYFWYAAGLTGNYDDDIQAQNYYLRRQKSHIEWIRHAIRGINLLAVTGCQPAESIGVEELKQISDLWLGQMDVRVEEGEKVVWYNPTYALDRNGQVGYFLAASLKSKKGVNLRGRESSGRNEALHLSDKFRNYTVLSWLVRILVALSVLIAVVLAWCQMTMPDSELLVRGTDMAIFTSALLPVVAMLLREINRQMGYEEDVNRYAWYYNAFKRAVIEIDEVYHDRDFPRCSDSKCEEIKRILFEIGQEALIENADWVMLNAKRVPEVPSN